MLATTVLIPLGIYLLSSCILYLRIRKQAIAPFNFQTVNFFSRYVDINKLRSIGKLITWGQRVDSL